MAYQDSDASLLGTLSAICSGGLQINLAETVTMSATLSTNAFGEAIDGMRVEMFARLNVDVSPALMISPEEDIILTATLNVEVIDPANFVNGYAALYGFLTSEIDPSINLVYCPDLYITLEIEEIINIGCTMNNQIELKRYRGDSYPVEATLGKNGSTSAKDIDFIMSTQIEGQSVWSADGIIEDEDNGMVSFDLSIDAVAIAGEGVYDIQGTDIDGYIYTYAKGKFILLEDVTV
ncbi:MAG: hypothetical protein KAH01_07245 [Caldisericia bacterium]|nr:hypothetical protein [Caldisericia bacterium]